MHEQLLGLGLAATADLLAAECRFNCWVLDEVKGSGLSVDDWLKFLEEVEEANELAKSAMETFRADGNAEALRSAFETATAYFNRRSLP